MCVSAATWVAGTAGGIESGLLIEKHHGYQYEHCFSYEWQVRCGYPYPMRLCHALNVPARYSFALAERA